MAKGKVYPVHEIEFTVNALAISDMETFSVAIDGNVVEWTPMDQGGWLRRLMTAKSITVSVSGKRSEGNEGNDYINGLALAMGEAATAPFEMTFPNGDTLAFDAVINVTALGGAAEDGAELSFDAMSDGAPTYTEATP